MTNHHSVLKCQLHSPQAQLPTRGSEHAAGFDLYAATPATIPAGSWAAIETGISIELPHGTYGRVAPRSGLAIQHGIDTLAGVIDSDYRGEIKCVLMNHANKDYLVHEGDRIAQLIIEAYHDIAIKEVAMLSDSKRADKGFGSTGKK